MKRKYYDGLANLANQVPPEKRMYLDDYGNAAHLLVDRPWGQTELIVATTLTGVVGKFLPTMVPQSELDQLVKLHNKGLRQSATTRYGAPSVEEMQLLERQKTGDAV